MIKNQLKSLFTIIFSICILGLYAQNQETRIRHSKGKFLGKSSPLRTWKYAKPQNPDYLAKAKEFKKELKSIPNFRNTTNNPEKQKVNSLPIGPDPTTKAQIQYSNQKSNMDEITVLQDYDAISFNEAQIWPPDCNGDIGLQYYIMTTNGGNGTILHIYDKFTGDLVEETTMDPLWTELGASPFGDPILFFDQIEERWVITEFTFSSLLMAVSETSDPLGSYNAYEIITTSFPDYPKYSNWDDAYFITSNEFNGYNPVYALDKEAMINGEDDVTVIEFTDITKFKEYELEVSTPLDFSGTLLPNEGTEFMAIRIMDDDWPNVTNDGIEYFEFDPNFDDPGASVINGPIELLTDPFDSNLCGYGLFDCLEQPNGTLVSAIHTVIMNRMQYRNFGTYESILLNFSVDVTGNNNSGIRWMELRKEQDSGWYIFQEGTYDLGDGVSRFMGTITQDAQGNVLMGYAMVSPEMFLSVGVTGRRFGETPGVMTLGEKVLVTGEQDNPLARWGDYFSVTVDPTTQSNFWLTSEYMPADQDWMTRLTELNIRRDSIDAQISQIGSPISSDMLSNAEEVKITVRNPGYKIISDVPWGVYFDGNLIETGVVAGDIQPLEDVEVTLTNTVDMSVIGGYEFKAYTALEGDENVLNDTLRLIISKLAMFDIAVSAGENPENGCKDLETFQGIYMNMGTNPIDGFTATISSGGSLIQSITYEEEVAPGESVLIVFEDVPVTPGANSFEIAVLDVDNEQVLDNNDVIINYEKFLDPVAATLSFQSGGFPFETSWEILNDQGEVIYEGGPYQDGEFATDNVELCFEEACYTFILYDDFFNGWIDNGEAFLEIVQEDGIKPVVLQDFDFGQVWTVDFCVPKECESLEVEVEYEDSSGPNTPDAAIFVNFPSGTSGAMYSIDGGDTFQSSPLFTNLVPGTYDVVVVDAFGCTYEETINVIVNTEDTDFTGELLITPNPSDGIIKLHLKGYQGSDRIIASIFDANGKLYGNYFMNQFSDGYHRSILLQNMPSGTYYTVIRDESFYKMGQFIKK